jgi:hypothetical protein
MRQEKISAEAIEMRRQEQEEETRNTISAFYGS